jgi:hypothetical protein
VNRYTLVWRHLAEFAREQNLGNEYSRSLAMRFEEVYGFREDKRLKPAERWRRHLVFALRILDDYARTGSVVRFVVEMSGLRIPQAMLKPMHDYERFSKERRHLRMSSLQERMHAIAVFLDFLRSRGVMALDRMQADDISAFITSRSCWKAKTVSHVASHLRSFLQFLFLRDILPRDFSSVVPTIRVARHDKVPSVWDQELVAKLLDVVDRNSPKGKRRSIVRVALEALLARRVLGIKVWFRIGHSDSTLAVSSSGRQNCRASTFL